MFLFTRKVKGYEYSLTKKKLMGKYYPHLFNDIWIFGFGGTHGHMK